MLYLMRKIGESIIINNNITVKVVEVRGRSVKLGFEFPPDVTVLREEIHSRIAQENLTASRGDHGFDIDIENAMLSAGSKNTNTDKPKLGMKASHGDKEPTEE